LEPALGVAGDDVGEGGFAGAGRAVEDQRAEAVGQQHPAEQLAGAEEVFLADELIEGAGPHPGGERTGTVAVLLPQVVEQVHNETPTGIGPPPDRTVGYTHSPAESGPHYGVTSSTTSNERIKSVLPSPTVVLSIVTR